VNVETYPTAWQSIRGDVEVPGGRVQVVVEYFAGSLDESYDWLKVGIEQATEAALRVLNEQHGV
jgi:hypothetical protein